MFVTMMNKGGNPEQEMMVCHQNHTTANRALRGTGLKRLETGRWIKQPAFLLFIILGMMYVPATAQDTTSNPMFLGFKPQYGFIIPHSKAIRDISNSNPYGGEVSFGWVLSQQSDWDRCNCYSKAGFGLQHINYDRPGILGHSTSLIMFAEPYMNYRGDFLASLRMGVGPSYLSKIYDEEKNPRNYFFSNHLSFLVHLDLSLNFRLGDQWFVNIYGKYNHISNGGLEEPNKGMNFPTAGLGLDYLFEPVEFAARQPLPAAEKGIIPSAGTYATVKKVVVDDDQNRQRTYGYGFFIKARTPVSRINALNAGLEYIWDGEIKAKSNGNHEHRQVTLLTGHDLIFGRFIFSQYWGTYLYAPGTGKNFFQRYALTYRLTSKLRAGVTLKAHAQVAQNFYVLVTYDLRGSG